MATIAYARQRNQGLGSGQAIMYQNPKNEVARRAPTTSDKKEVGTFWFYPLDINNNPVGNVYVQTYNTGSNWIQLAVQGGSGSFASLTVTPGPISLTGTTSINTAGAGVTSIGVGGTGAVNIGNATGNTDIVAGNLNVTAGDVNVDTGSIVVSLGNIDATAGNVTAGALLATTNGNLRLGTAGNKIVIATGANASLGTSAAMVAGSVTVATTAVTASSIIFLTANTPGGTQGTLSAPTASIIAGTSFVINSSNAADTSTVNWWIVN